MSAIEATTELFLGNYVRRPDNETLKDRGLSAINAYRNSEGAEKLAELPRAHPGAGYDVCLLGACCSDLTGGYNHAVKMSESHHDIHQLEIRFERGAIPELIAEPGEMPVLRYVNGQTVTTSHDHALAV